MRRIAYIYEKTIAALLDMTIEVSAVCCRTDKLDAPYGDMCEGLPCRRTSAVNLNDLGQASGEAKSDD